MPISLPVSSSAGFWILRRPSTPASIETLPKQFPASDRLRVLLPTGTRVYLTDIGTSGADAEMPDAARRLQDVACIPVAHLVVRRISAQAFAHAVRAHWAVENGLHWVLDMAFDEDCARARKDHAAENMAIIRKLAINVLKTARPEISIRRKRKRSGWSDKFARTVIAQMR